MTNFNELLFSELRVVPVVEKLFPVTEESIVRAITDNENLTSLGYTLKPDDIFKLSRTSDFSIYDTVKQYVNKVNAEPMYPNFPNQVMEINEARFRLHQIMHYFSTYGMEWIFDITIRKGWLPDVERTEKIKDQTVVLPSKTISLIDEDTKYEYVIKKLLTKRERLTIPEKQLITEAVNNVDHNVISNISIPFKENLMDIFVILFDNKKDELIKQICQHTGDLLTCLRYLLVKHWYRLTTSERKRCVRLIESYPVSDFRANLILSNRKAKNSFIVLDYLSYNKFSRSIEHKKAVKDFRDGKLRSWESVLKEMLNNGDDEVLIYISKRPGMLVRMVAWLLRLGYQENKIRDILVENAASLSVQTLVTILNKFGTSEFENRKERDGVYRIILSTLEERLKYLNTPFNGKKIFIDEGIYNFKNSCIEANEKSEEGGYIRSGLSFKIPDNIDILRFFVYWNDKERVDIDLHSYAVDTLGKNIHIGWNSDFRNNGIAHSGDITHSDAAEYIDIDMKNTTVSICANDIHIYSGKNTFGEIDTCFTGMMGLSRSDLSEDVVLYDPKNCFFYHNLCGKENYLNYCVIEPQRKLMRIVAKKKNFEEYSCHKIEAGLSVDQYLRLLLSVQGASITTDIDSADFVVSLDKSGDISLIDENYYMDH